MDHENETYFSKSKGTLMTNQQTSAKHQLISGLIHSSTHFLWFKVEAIFALNCKQPILWTPKSTVRWPYCLYKWVIKLQCPAECLGEMSCLPKTSSANVFIKWHKVVSLVFGSVTVNFTPRTEGASEAKYAFEWFGSSTVNGVVFLFK